MRLLGIFILALAVVLLLTFQNVNGDEHNLQIRERRDGPRHHPDIGRNPGASHDRKGPGGRGRSSHGHSPSHKGSGGHRSPGKNKHKSPKHNRKHGHNGGNHHH